MLETLIGTILLNLFTPVSEAVEPIIILKNQIITAYSSSPDETWGDPTIMANNQKVFYGAVANNCLPFGTEVNIMGADFIVSDRKNKRYGCEWWDIWLPSKQEAINFGIWYNQEAIIHK